MKAEEIMIQQVYKVKENETVRSVIEKFLKYHISGLPVVNDRNEIVAYVSDGDIMRYIGTHEERIFDTFSYIVYVKGDDDEFEDRIQKLLNLNVLQIAKKKVITVPWNVEIEKVASILGKKQIKKLPVERDGVLVGIISRGDVIRHSFKAII